MGLGLNPKSAGETKRIFCFGGSRGLLLACLTFVVLVAGCGAHSDLLQVSGKVSLDGDPLPRGLIRLTSVESERVSSTGAMIRDGKYIIPQEKGLLPGTYQIVISAANEQAPAVMARDASGRPKAAVAQELIPAEYNFNSQKKVNVTIDGENYFEFDILSEPANKK